MKSTYKGLPIHPPGRVLTDLAVTLADGGDCLADLTAAGPGRAVRAGGLAPDRLPGPGPRRDARAGPRWIWWCLRGYKAAAVGSSVRWPPCSVPTVAGVGYRTRSVDHRSGECPSPSIRRTVESVAVATSSTPSLIAVVGVALLVAALLRTA